MTAVVGITLIKVFTYRDDSHEEFANQYWLSGDVPANGTDWKALADALIAQEKTVYTSLAAVVRAYGYDSDDPAATAVWSYDYQGAGQAVAGTLALGTQVLCPGDAAVWARWKTSRLNSKGRAIFLRKYFHPATHTAASNDAVGATQKTALEAFATKLHDGTFLDARTIRSRTHAETILSSGASGYVTTHTLKRRGKRPGS